MKWVIIVIVVIIGVVALFLGVLWWMVPDWPGFSEHGDVNTYSDMAEDEEEFQSSLNFGPKYDRAVEILDDIGEVGEVLIVVDVSEQKEYVFMDGGVLVSIYKVATGSTDVFVSDPEDVDPEEGDDEEEEDPYEDRSMGQSVWRISWKRDSDLASNYGPRLMMMDRYYKGTWLQTKVALHGTDRPEQLGTPVSLGCVYHENADIIELYDLVDVGTFVVAIW